MRDPGKTLVRLDIETRAYHADLEQAWSDVVARGRRPTRDEYIAQLIRIYGFESPLEAALAYTPHLAGVLDVHRRFRSGLIAQDLLKLGVTPLRLTDIRQRMLAPFSSVAEALGWLYVHELPTRMHDRVRRELVVRLPEVREATSYLSSTDGSVNILWDDFARALDRFAASDDIVNRITQGANDAFRAALDWYEEYEPQQRRHG